MTERARHYELAMYSARGVQTFPLAPGQTLVIGRGDDVDIKLEDPGISRRHAAVYGGPPLEVEDLESANGTFVSRAARAGGSDTAQQKRAPVTRSELAIGDSIFLGAAVLVVREGAASATDALVKSPALTRVWDEATRAAMMTLPIVLIGETGVGKDVLARHIHARSARAKAPFVALNCAALSETLADSQLFGHEKGAFTGAEQKHAGVFETANGGTLFLDEIGELPLATQAKLLRTLENAEVQRLGSTRAIKVDVRFVSATNRDLERATREGTFRADLYFRLNGITLHIPPLRERREEIGPLARRFLEAASKSAKLATPVLADDAIAALEAYAWPGNVRELRWTMERVLVSAGAGAITRAHLPSQITAPRAPSSSKVDVASREPLASKEQVMDALAKCDGNQTQAAALLGISRRTLINRMIEFNLPRPRKA